jgi:CBS domain-containing protein
MLASQILKSKKDDGVVSVPPGTSIGRAAEVLSSRRIGALVISMDGKVIQGILSERDVVRELGRRGAACLDDAVETIMTARVTTCSRDDLAEDLLAKMTAGRFRHLPVIEAGHMVGLISIGDVVKARLDELSREKDALEGMIKGF